MNLPGASFRRHGRIAKLFPQALRNSAAAPWAIHFIAVSNSRRLITLGYGDNLPKPLPR